MLLLDHRFLNAFVTATKTNVKAKNEMNATHLATNIIDVYKRQLPFIPDYRINLLAPREITDFTGFRTSCLLYTSYKA